MGQFWSVHCLAIAILDFLTEIATNGHGCLMSAVSKVSVSTSGTHFHLQSYDAAILKTEDRRPHVNIQDGPDGKRHPASIWHFLIAFLSSRLNIVILVFSNVFNYCQILSDSAGMTCCFVVVLQWSMRILHVFLTRKSYVVHQCSLVKYCSWVSHLNVKASDCIVASQRRNHVCCN